MNLKVISYLILYNGLLMYGGGYWFYQLFRSFYGSVEFTKGLFSTYSIELADVNIYPLIPTISIAIAVHFLLLVRKMGKAGLIKP